jgi:hypothetical protein
VRAGAYVWTRIKHMRIEQIMISCLLTLCGADDHDFYCAFLSKQEEVFSLSVHIMNKQKL